MPTTVQLELGFVNPDDSIDLDVEAAHIGMDRRPAIYRILNLQNNKSYIGHTRNVSKRVWHHVRDLRRDEHYNRHLQYAWDKYGAEAFVFGVVEYLDEGCSDDKLVDREGRWMDAFDALQNGYNIIEADKTEAQHRRWSGDGNPKWGKGDEVSGEDNPMAVLTYRAVLEIKLWLRDTDKTQEAIAERFDVSRPAIKDINVGDHWSDVGNFDHPVRPNGTRGSRNAMAVIDEGEALEIKVALDETDTPMEDIADDMGVNRQLVGAVNRGDSWKHVGDYDHPIRDGRRGEEHSQSVLSAEDVVAIRRRYDRKGEIYEDIAEDYPVGAGTIGRIVRGDSWTHVGGPTK